jgi:hypothetical protein
VNDQELTGEITTRLRALCPRGPVPEALRTI